MRRNRGRRISAVRNSSRPRIAPRPIRPNRPNNGITDLSGGPGCAQGCPNWSCPSLTDDGSLSALDTINSFDDHGFDHFQRPNDQCGSSLSYCEFAYVWNCLSDAQFWGWSSNMNAAQLFNKFAGSNCCMSENEWENFLDVVEPGWDN